MPVITRRLTGHSNQCSVWAVPALLHTHQQWFCFPIRFPGGSLEAPRSSQDAIPFPIPSSQLVPRMIAKRSFPAPGWVPGLPGLPGLPVGSQDGHPYIRYGNSACRWLHLSVDHMTIGKELLVSNLLTTLLWCQRDVESSYSFLDSLHQYACPFSTEFCDDLHLGSAYS